MRLFAYVLVCLSILVSCKGNDKTVSAVGRIDNYLLEIEKAGFNGTVAVALNDGTVYCKAFGWRDRENNLKNEITTVFDIGSVTKQFTAAAILKLEMQGKLSTSDKISIYFKDLPADKENITIHHLLRHRSGLISNIGGDYDAISKEDFLKKVFESKLAHEINTQYDYSNIGYSLLAMIIEGVSEQTYEQYLYENLWQPAEMEMTGYTRPVYEIKNIAVGYWNHGERWGKPVDHEWDKDAPFWHLKGNGGVLSTAEDMLKWHFALEKGNILPAAAIKKLYQPMIEADDDPDNYYAYGWSIEKTENNTRRVGHNGSNGVFFTDYFRFIDESIAILHLSNSYNASFSLLNQEIQRLIFEPGYIPAIPVEDNAENRRFTEHIATVVADRGIEKAREAYAARTGNIAILETHFIRKASEYLQKQDTAAALLILDMNLQLHPASSRAYRTAGIMYRNLGNNALALKYLNEALRLNPYHYSIKSAIKKIQQ